ncbi:hypothetical protein B0T24DRAFT_594394 [Lasiosphaeria ovina]|uniref:Transmembrane protein n=1 Tax=Lasiosphaeria ovina TaxID=92902 RepID=A0AAE0N852_9PEZI|nr:hypothetical protein B0T24DRAFT_594394 [Lasiosphaeria ovina]
MSRRRTLVLGFLLNLVLSVHSMRSPPPLSGGAAGQISMNVVEASTNPIDLSSQRQSEVVVKIRRHTRDAQEPVPVLTAVPTAASRPFGVTGPVTTAACLMTTALDFHRRRRRRREEANLLATVSSLNKALVSGDSNAPAMSEQLLSSISQLRSSAESLSSALVGAQASASSAISAVEASAASAVSAARESTASVPAVETSSTTLQKQVDSGVPAAQSNAVAVAQTAVAVVASVIGSSIFSLLGFYLFIRHRRAKLKQQEEEEQEVNAALDRAIVSYIVKEHPSPTKTGWQGTEGMRRSESHNSASRSHGPLMVDMPRSLTEWQLSTQLPTQFPGMPASMYGYTMDQPIKRVASTSTGRPEPRPWVSRGPSFEAGPYASRQSSTRLLGISRPSEETRTGP